MHPPLLSPAPKIVNLNLRQGSYLPTAVRASVFGLLYVLGAELGHFLSFPDHFATFWPPSGIYLIALLLTERRLWPVVVLVAMCANLTSDIMFHGQQLWVSLGFWMTNSAEALFGAWLMHRFVSNSFTLTSLKEVIHLTSLAAVISSALGAVFGATVISLAFQNVDFGTTWRIWCVSDVLGVIIFAPFTTTLISLGGPASGERQHSRFGEATFVFSLLIMLSQFVLGNQIHPYAFLIYPMLIWIALQFEMGTLSLANLVLTFIAIWNTKQGRGPFVGDDSIADQVLLLQSFLSVSAASSMVLAAVVAERRRTTEAVQENEDRYRDLLENINDLVHSVSPEGQILYANRAWRLAIGYQEQDLKQLSIFELIHPHEHSTYRDKHRRILSGERVDHWESRLVTKSGQIIIVEGSCNCRIENGKAVATRSIFRDITKRREHERELESSRKQLVEANSRLLLLATTDSLTSLQNRRGFESRMVEEVERAQRYDSSLSLLMLDIDHFKQFNDTFGHPAGDEILKRVSAILEQTVRASDFVSRFGGEEFAIILPNADEATATLLAERLREAIYREHWKDRRITASIGVATLTAGFPIGDDCNDGTMLLKAADEALYFSKQKGRNRSHHAKALRHIEV
ncbi:MAG: domain S-box-containing protein/diguanylate cyclase protein [Planctomycetaceae bacterium]|nr:domain S-box-containing protein/diguanylate cyclase protein [Planctomycetaceae bacterium]